MAGRSRGRYEKQLKLYALLQERDGDLVTTQEISERTGWKPAGVRTYLAKGLLDGVLHAQGAGKYMVSGASSLTEAAFLRLLSQSKERQRFGHQFPPLVRQLLERSRTNIGLAIETYNRATLDNRLDAFVLLFVTAWEQLLKAELEVEEPGSIFTGAQTRDGRGITITFQQCLDRRLRPIDPIRRNLEVIRSLRDSAAHLLVAEVQPAAALYFQAGIRNYAERFFDFAGENAMPVVGAGLLTLAMPYQRLDPVALRARYGEATAAEVVALVDSLEEEAHGVSDSRFAIQIKYRLVLSEESGASTIRLSKSSDSDATAGFVVEKAIDAERGYPYFESELIVELSRRTSHAWGQSDVRAAVFVEKVKKADNEFHHHFRKTDRHAYSEKFVERLVERVGADPSYLKRARASWQADLKKRRKK